MLVCQCIVNNWFVVMDGYAAMTGSEFTRLYFISFYFVATVFVLNLVRRHPRRRHGHHRGGHAHHPGRAELRDIDDDDEARFLNSDEQAEEVRRAERKWPPAPRSPGGARAGEAGVRRMMSLGIDEQIGDDVAQQRWRRRSGTRASRSARLWNPGAFAALSQARERRGDEETLSLAELRGRAGVPRRRRRKDAMTPDRQRLSGGCHARRRAGAGAGACARGMIVRGRRSRLRWAPGIGQRPPAARAHVLDSSGRGEGSVGQSTMGAL